MGIIVEEKLSVVIEIGEVGRKWEILGLNFFCFEFREFFFIRSILFVFIDDWWEGGVWIIFIYYYLVWI